MDIKKFSLTELKAMAYDQLAQLEHIQQNIRLINAEIAEKSKPMNEEEIVTEVASEVEAPVEATEVSEEVTEEVAE